MAQLRLGPLPKVGMTRLTITLPEPLKEELDQYAAEHSPASLIAITFEV